MNFIWLRTVLALGASLAAGLVAWPLFGPAWALAVVVVGLGALLASHLLSLRMLVTWLRDPLNAPVPAGSGAWEHVFSALYRLVRATTQHQHRLTGQLARFRSARSSSSKAPLRTIAENNPALATRMPATITFCSTLMERNSRMFWNVRAMPRDAMRAGLQPLTSSPSNSTLPPSGRYTPVTTLNTVVLPAPFGPIRPKICFGSTVN